MSPLTYNLAKGCLWVHLCVLNFILLFGDAGNDGALMLQSISICVGFLAVIHAIEKKGKG